MRLKRLQKDMNCFRKSKLFFSFLFTYLSLTSYSFGMVEEVLPPLLVSKSNINTFSSPVVYHDGAVYVVNVEPAEGISNGINLRTVVRKGVINGSGGWSWSSNVIENGTLEDTYHTQASISVDKNGYLHVAYNMHNMPWQYAVSALPSDISNFVFLGDSITEEEKFAVKHLNQTPFPSIGTAAIPGNQVTYPSFFQDRNHDLYVTYRYATRPKRAWVSRGFAGGIAKYDVINKIWKAIGGPLLVTNEDADLPGETLSTTTFPFAYRDQWSVYLIRLWFDNNNDMHLSWMWRDGGAGVNTTHPTYAFSPDGGNTFFRANGSQYQLPIDVVDADVVVNATEYSNFYANTSITVDSSGTPSIVMQPVEKPRIRVHYDQSNGKWSESELSPSNATVLIVDSSGQQWAFAPGLRILKREREGTPWKQIYLDQGYCFPKVFTVFEENMSFIHTQSCDLQYVKILKLDWKQHITSPQNLHIK